MSFFGQRKEQKQPKKEGPWHFLFGSWSFWPALGRFDHSPAALNVFWTLFEKLSFVLPCSAWIQKMLPWTSLLQTLKRNVIKRILKRYSQKCSDCSDHILSQEDLNDEIPGNSSSLDTFQELLYRARAAGEYTTDAGRHGQHFYAIVSIICIFRNTRGRFPVDRLRGFHSYLQLCLLRPSHLCWLQGRQKRVRYFQE